jgi:hypothetical protein
MAIAGLVLPVAVVLFWGAVVVPQARVFRGRAIQRECRHTLKQIAQAEERWFSAHSAYSTDPVELGFFPKRGNRYSYFLAASGPLQPRSTVDPPRPERGTAGIEADTFQFPEQRAYAQGELPALLDGAVVGVAGTCPRCSFTAACVGNVDEDATLDVWSVSSKLRVKAGGETVGGWEPFNEVDDAKW